MKCLRCFRSVRLLLIHVHDLELCIFRATGLHCNGTWKGTCLEYELPRAGHCVHVVLWMSAESSGTGVRFLIHFTPSCFLSFLFFSLPLSFFFFLNRSADSR